MIWDICFYVALAITVIFTVWSVSVAKHRKEFNKNVDVIILFAVGAFLSATIVFIPIYNQVIPGDSSSVIKTLLIAVHNAIRLFVVDADYQFIIDNVNSVQRVITPWYTLYVCLLYVACPVCTFGVILSFFKNVSAIVRLIFAYFNPLFVFSQLNEKTLALATDLKNNEKRRVIVFCNVNAEDDGTSELIGESKKIGAICFKKEIENVNFGIHFNRAEVQFFLISEDNSENLTEAVHLVELYGDTPNSYLYLLSNTIDGELFLSIARNKKMQVRRINEAQSLVNHNLYHGGEVLFNKAKEVKGESEKVISAIIVGLGKYGKEMLKTLLWYCQMDGYKLIINAFDKDKHAKDKFTAECPEIMDERYNWVIAEGEAQYGVEIYDDCYVEGYEFIKKIKKITDATYVFVALGSDEENIKTAVNLRTVFEQMGINPIIQAVVYNSQFASSLQGVTNFKNQPYAIDFIGDLRSIYSEGVILDSKLEEEAVKRHKKYGNEIEFWQYEYNYRSSIAAALHMDARIKCNIKGANKPEEELTEQERENIERLEHRRWNAYMRSQGYIYSGSKEKSSRNDLGKMHNDLVDFDSLSEEEKRKDSRVGTK